MAVKAPVKKKLSKCGWNEEMEREGEERLKRVKAEVRELAEVSRTREPGNYGLLNVCG